MVWVKLSDTFADEMDDQDISPDALTLYVAGLCYCNRLENDGRIPRRKAAGLYSMDDPAAAVAELVAAGKWAETDAGYQVVGQYAEDGGHQKTAKQLADERAATAARVAAFRERRATGRLAANNGLPAPTGNAVTHGVSNGVSNAVPSRPGPTEGKGKGKDGSPPPASPSAGAPGSFSGGSVLSQQSIPGRPAYLAANPITITVEKESRS